MGLPTLRLERGWRMSENEEVQLVRELEKSYKAGAQWAKKMAVTLMKAGLDCTTQEAFFGMLITAHGVYRMAARGTPEEFATIAELVGRATEMLVAQSTPEMNERARVQAVKMAEELGVSVPEDMRTPGGFSLNKEKKGERVH